MSRPEHLAPPEIFYNEEEAIKYSNNSRMIEIQTKMSERALGGKKIELLNIQQPSFLLDIGCGSGLSGEVLTEHGHQWVGVDISEAMLAVSNEKEVEGDLCLLDMGHGMPFRPGTFDGVISISALQWLCNADKSCNVPIKRLKCFFQTLYNCLVRGGKAVFQFYPENPKQMELITSQAMKYRVGFTGGLVVDYPNSTKAKKIFLVLFSGPSEQLPEGKQGLGEEEQEDLNSQSVNYLSNSQRTKRRHKKDTPGFKSKEWVLKKKQRQRDQGKEVRVDTKYTARPRKGAF